MISPDGRRSRVLTSAVCVTGLAMLATSFIINPGPPPDATSAQLTAFETEYFTSVLWGAWLQAVGPILIVFFAIAVVRLAGATAKLSGLMTILGAAILVMVSLLEVTFYIAALFGGATTSLSLNIIAAVQHLYFVAAAPALFVPLGFVVIGTSVLPRYLGYAAVAFGVAFALLGVAFLSSLTLPAFVTAFAGVQVVWWLAASLALVVRS